MKQLFLVLFLLASLTARAQSAAWTFAFPLTDPNGIEDVATDDNGNFYVTGRFTGSLQLGGTLLTSASPGPCLYLAKCRPSGQVVRVTKLEGATDVLPTSIAVAEDGSSYVTGNFLGTLTYDGGQQTTALSASGRSVFVLKCGPGGAVKWVQQGYGGPDASGCLGAGVAVDRAGNSYITGTVGGSNVQFGKLTFGPRRNQGFVASYNQQGRLRWARVFSSPPPGNGSSNGGGVAVDNAGSCYLSGTSFDGFALDEAPFLNPGSANYLAKFDAQQGQLRWAQFTPTEGDGHAIGTDKQGNVYIGGSFTGTVRLGRRTLTSAGSYDGFVACYTPRGTVDWATAVGGADYDVVSDLAVDSKSGKVFATGQLDFTSESTNCAFLQRFDTQGRAKDLEKVSGPGTSSGGSLAIDDNNIIYTTGVFTGSCGFGSLTLNTQFTQSYLGRYGKQPASLQQDDYPLVATTFPNPVQNQLTLRLANLSQPAQAKLYNQYGSLAATQALQSGAAVDAVFDTTSLLDGLYVLRLESNGTTTSSLVVVQH